PTTLPSTPLFRSQAVAASSPEPARQAPVSEVAGAAEFAPPETGASMEEMRASHEAEKLQPENGGESAGEVRRPTEEIDVASILHQRHQQAEHARHEPLAEADDST